MVCRLGLKGGKEVIIGEWVRGNIDLLESVKVRGFLVFIR